PSLFEQVVAVEKELVDDYARDRLSPHERELFERHYLAHPKRRARAKIAVALASKLDQEKGLKIETETSSWWQDLFGGFRSHSFVLGMTFATLLLALGVLWLLFETRRLRSELDQSRISQATIEQRERALQGMLRERQDSNEKLSAELENMRTAQQTSTISSAPSF